MPTPQLSKHPDLHEIERLEAHTNSFVALVSAAPDRNGPIQLTEHIPIPKALLRMDSQVDQSKLENVGSKQVSTSDRVLPIKQSSMDDVLVVQRPTVTAVVEIADVELVTQGDLILLKLASASAQRIKC